MSKEKETFRDLFLKGAFAETYIQIVVPVIASELNKALKDKDYDFFSAGSEYERKVKAVYNYFNQLLNVIEDLEKTIIFLRLPDHSKVMEIHPQFDQTESYYNYFIENYIIRINSISDVLGKILDLVYQTHIEKPNMHLFRNKIEAKFAKLSEMLQNLSERIFLTKEKRHEKLHEGSTEFDYLKSVVFWHDLHKLMKQQTPEELVKGTQENLNKMVDNISNEIQDYVILVREILNYSTNQLKNYLG